MLPFCCRLREPWPGPRPSYREACFHRPGDYVRVGKLLCFQCRRFAVVLHVLPLRQTLDTQGSTGYGYR